jgi:hypothetical protein
LVFGIACIVKGQETALTPPSARVLPQERFGEMEARRRGDARSLSAVASRMTARAAGLSLLDQPRAPTPSGDDGTADPDALAGAGGRRWAVCGEVAVCGSVSCARDLYYLLNDDDLRAADQHEHMLQRLLACAAALERAGRAAGAGPMEVDGSMVA